MNADDLDLSELADPALDGLVRALTADGTAGELAGREAALAIFRASRRRPRRLRLAVSMSTAAAAVVLAGGLAAAYAAALPAPVQHIASRMLGRIGVPDTPRPAPPSGAPGVAVSIPATPSAPAIDACRCQSGGPGPGIGTAVPSVVLAAARTQIPAGGQVVLSGWLAAGGRPEAGVRVGLSEDVAGGPGWQAAGSAVTDGDGEVTLTVAHLTSNASFRLDAPGRAVSAPVVITVIPRVYLGLAPGQRPGLVTLTATAQFAQPGDVVVLQRLSGGIWYRVGLRVLGPDHLASFTVRIPLLEEAAYRVVLPRTADHGRSASRPVRLAPRLALSAAVARTARRASP